MANERSGVVLLLPHGYEGQGPDHSSGRIERFLSLCAQNNMTVSMPSVPSNYFHLLRWQALNGQHKPASEHLRSEVAETVVDPSDVDAELRHLIGAWLSAAS